jgi:hypothetical protein
MARTRRNNNPPAKILKINNEEPPMKICFYCDKKTPNDITYLSKIICDKCNEELENGKKYDNCHKTSKTSKKDNLENIINYDVNVPDINITLNEPKTPPHITNISTNPPPTPKKNIKFFIIKKNNDTIFKKIHHINKLNENNPIIATILKKNKHCNSNTDTNTNRCNGDDGDAGCTSSSSNESNCNDGKDDDDDGDNGDNGKDEDNEDDEDKCDKDNENCCSIDNNSDLFFNSLIKCLQNIENIKNNDNIPSKKNNSSSSKKTLINDEDDSDLEFEWLGSEIKDINDLIRVGKSYNPKKRKRHNLNLKRLNMLVEPLTELQNMIGMTDVKKIIFDQIIYYLQTLDDKNVDMLHTVIVGPPGVGKTQLTHIIAKIYNKLGFLKTDKVICARRDDLIAEYVGQTAIKTRKVLEKALGGVLLLDEVYSLSPTSERDFAKEAIDMINMYLSEHCHELVCVVAGYKKPTYEKFMSQNEGLARRFTHHFEIKGYTPEELALILKKYVEEQKWEIGEPLENIIPIIEKNIKMFPYFGGDMTTLFACCKKTHSRRLLLIPTEKELLETKKKLKIADIEAGILLFKDIKEKSNSNELDDKDKYQHMYS